VFKGTALHARPVRWHNVAWNENGTEAFINLHICKNDISWYSNVWEEHMPFSKGFMASGILRCDTIPVGGYHWHVALDITVYLQTPETNGTGRASMDGGDKGKQGFPLAVC
jgi:hypothetical protein